MFENINIGFSPELPMALIISLSVLIAALCLFGLLRQVRGSFVRAIAGGLFILALFNPALLQENRTPIKTIIPLVIDQTTSQKLNQRDAQTIEAVESIKANLAKHDAFELREIYAKDQLSQTTDVSSALFGALQSSLQDVPKEQLGGAIFVTDGQVHDVPDNPDHTGINGPLHVILTGRENERDRQIKLTSAPRFGVVDEEMEILYMLEETGFLSSDNVEVTININGEKIATQKLRAGKLGRFKFKVPHSGKNIIEFIAQTAEGEITEINNRTFTVVNGIRENLRVLLISGEPHSGERAWRNLLKSDATVDLVHFTILRPPEKQDGTPINELSLIAFPTRELFVQKIDEFDLIIFDRYKRRAVLPILYFDNMARYVRDGGAILLAAGPEYAEIGNIGITPLGTVLPALSDGNVREGPFVPRISDIGQKHPVTRNLDGWNEEKPQWSRWFRTIGVEPSNKGHSVMVDENEAPILMLQQQEKGRVALFLSDHVWLWSRGFEGGGPHVQLLRRLAHWLMKEPELEEERLTASSNGKLLTITRQTLKDQPEQVEVITPSGDTMSHEFEAKTPGVWTVEMQVDEIGLYRITNDELTALAQVGPANPRELSAVISTGDILEPVVKASQGSITRMANNAIPRFLPVGQHASKSGRNWAGLVNTNSSVLNGVTRIPLFGGLLGLVLLLLGISAMWLREGR